MIFSARTPGSLFPNRLTIALEALRRSGRPHFDLTTSNPTRAGFVYPERTVLEALARPAALQYGADPRGLVPARQAVAGYYREREGLEVPVDRLLLTASTSEAYSFLLKLLCDPGASVLVPSPSYPLFDDLLRLESVRAIPYPLRYDGGWHIDPGALPGLIAPDTRAVIVVNPNNPTGVYLKRDERARLAGLCRQHQLALISDEVFADYAWTPDPHRIETVAAHDDVLCFSLSGLSKVVGLPQMKLGWILVNGPTSLVSEAIDRLELIADTFLSVGTPVQEALPALLETRHDLQAQIRARVAGNRARLIERVAQQPALGLLSAEGGWYLTIRVPRVLPEEQMALELIEADGVQVHPGYFFDFPSEAYLVVSLLTPPEVFEEGIHRLMRRLAAWTQPLQ